MEQLLAVVLCGGESRRMGTDKGLITEAEQTWAQRTFDKLRALNMPVVISINYTQLGHYSVLFDTDILVIDKLNIPGPLNGILSVHANYPNKDILTLACDMIDMDSITLKTLIHEYQSKTGYDFYAYHNSEFYEPLCAIYTATGLQKLHEDALTNYSLQQVLNNSNTKRLFIARPAAFKNQNSV